VKTIGGSVQQLARRNLAPVRPRRLVVVVGISGLVGLLGVGVVALLGGFDRIVSERVNATGTQTARVALVDALVGFDVTPDELIVERGTHVELEVVNEGDEPHDLLVPGGPGTRTLSPGESERLDLGVVTASTPPRLWCTLAGHRAAGMTLDIRVVTTNAARRLPAAAESSSPMRRGAAGALGAVPDRKRTRPVIGPGRLLLDGGGGSGNANGGLTGRAA